MKLFVTKIGIKIILFGKIITKNYEIIKYLIKLRIEFFLPTLILIVFDRKR